MPNKNMYYPAGFQEQVDDLLKKLTEQGVDLVNSKQNTLSESKLFRWLVEQKLMELANGSNDAKRTTTP